MKSSKQLLMAAIIFGCSTPAFADLTSFEPRGECEKFTDPLLLSCRHEFFATVSSDSSTASCTAVSEDVWEVSCSATVRCGSRLEGKIVCPEGARRTTYSDLGHRESVVWDCRDEGLSNTCGDFDIKDSTDILVTNNPDKLNRNYQYGSCANGEPDAKAKRACLDLLTRRGENMTCAKAAHKKGCKGQDIYTSCGGADDKYDKICCYPKAEVATPTATPTATPVPTSTR